MRRIVLSTLCIGAVILAGCSNDKQQGGSTNTTTNGAATKTVTYAIIPKMLNNPVFTLAQRGAEKAARDLEAKTPGTKYSITYQSSQTGVASEQAETINTLANKKVDGMSISAIDANAIKQPINDAMDKNIPVICFDSNAVGSKAITLFGIDDQKVGNALANEIIQAIGKDKMDGEFAILSGQSSAPNLQTRIKGVTDVINAKDYPKAKFLPILYCDDKPDKAVELIRTTMQAHPKLKGFLFVGGWPLFAKGALDNVDPNVTKVVSLDALPAERDYLRAGKVYCLLGQRCFAWGEQSVLILDQIRTGTKKDWPKFVDSGYDIVYKSPTPEQRKLSTPMSKVYSVDEYDKLWDEWNKQN